MGNIGTAIGSAALGGLTGGVGGLVTGAIGGIGSLLGLGSRKEKKAREAEEREYQRQLEYMALQAKYNKEQAQYTTELSKEMWDYTNYENQVEHLKKANQHLHKVFGSFPVFQNTKNTPQANKQFNTTINATILLLKWFITFLLSFLIPDIHV